HPAAATFTLKHVCQKDAFHQLRPAIVALPRRWRFASCRLDFNIRDRRQVRRNCGNGADGGGILVNNRWYDQRSPCGSGTKNPVMFGEVGAGRGYQHCKFGHEILPVENDSAGSVSPWTFQTVEETAVGQ